MTMDEYSEISIKVPKQLITDLERVIKEYDFNSMDEFIIFLLKEVMNLYKGIKPETEASIEDSTRKKTLKELGYL